MKIKVYLQKNQNSLESRVVTQAVLTSDVYELVPVSYDDLFMLDPHEIRQGLPIGSVEFMQRAMDQGSIIRPNLSPYPHRLAPVCVTYTTEVTVKRFFRALRGRQRMFVKPVRLKQFNGFVCYDADSGHVYDEHDQEQYDILCSLPDDDCVYLGSVVEWASEWRYYIDDRSMILGRGRYDANDTDDRAVQPDAGVVQLMIEVLGLDHPYCLDVGVLSTGETRLVEFTDAWAVGLYGDALNPLQYLRFLAWRWRSIIHDSGLKLAEMLAK